MNRPSAGDPLFDLTDRVVVVTGGLGRLGRQFSTTLLARGARVAVLDAGVKDGIDPEPVFGAELAGNARLVAADVRRRDSLEAALEEIQREWGAPHALINNAALDSPPDAPAEENGPFENYPSDSWDDVMDVNVKGCFQCCQVFGGAMAEAGRGSIVQISSIYGLVSPDQRIYEYQAERGTPFFKPVAYSASKSALFNMTRYLATYWAPMGVRVNTLTFGGVFAGQDADFLSGYQARVPLGRMAREDEYNGAVVFLVSEASSYMTGSNLVIDGGWTAW